MCNKSRLWVSKAGIFIGKREECRLLHLILGKDYGMILYSGLVFLSAQQREIYAEILQKNRGIILWRTN